MVDMPDVPAPHTPVMIVQALQAQRSPGKIDRTIGVCSLVQNPVRETALNEVGPTGAAQVYFQIAERRVVTAAGVVTVLRNPRHGTLASNPEAPGGYLYLPKSNYFGPDRATFLVKMSGKKFQMEYFFQVLPGVADDYTKRQYKQLCPNGSYWKISLNPDHPNARSISFQHTNSLTSYQMSHNPALNLAPFGRWTLRDKAAQRRLA